MVARIQRDVRTLLLVLAIAVAGLLVAPVAADASVNGCPHQQTFHFHGAVPHYYHFHTQYNVVSSQGAYHMHVYIDDYPFSSKPKIYKRCTWH